MRNGNHIIICSMQDHNPLPPNLITNFLQLFLILVVPSCSNDLKHESFLLERLSVETF